MVSPQKDRQDMQRLIRLILDTPLQTTSGKKGRKQVVLDEGMSMEDLKGQNLDVKTRMLTAQALQACNGDRASAEFLMKYGGLEPPKEQSIYLEPPTFVDDLGADDDETPLKVRHDETPALEDGDPKILEDAVLYNDPDEST